MGKAVGHRYQVELRAGGDVAAAGGGRLGLKNGSSAGKGGEMASGSPIPSILA